MKNRLTPNLPHPSHRKAGRPNQNLPNPVNLHRLAKVEVLPHPRNHQKNQTASHLNRGKERNHRRSRKPESRRMVLVVRQISQEIPIPPNREMVVARQDLDRVWIVCRDSRAAAETKKSGRPSVATTFARGRIDCATWRKH